MPTYQLLTATKPNSTQKNSPSQEYAKLIASIQAITYDEKGPHNTQFLQLKNVVTAIENEKTAFVQKAKTDASKTEQTKPVLSQRERRRLNAQATSPVNQSETKLVLPYEKWISILIGAALFTQKQIDEDNTLPIVGFKVSKITPPTGTMVTSGSSLYQSIENLNAITNLNTAENNDQAKKFFKRTFSDWYNEKFNHEINGEKLSSVGGTPFNIEGLASERSEAIRARAENILKVKFGQLPEISPEQYQVFFQEKNFDNSTYAKSDAKASSGLVMGAVDIVSGTVSMTSSIVATSLSYVIPSSLWGASAKTESAKPEAQTSVQKDDSVKVNTSSLAIGTK